MAQILLGVTGSIAAIKIPQLIHELTKQGHDCKVIITRDGLNFVTPLALTALGATVYLDDDSYEPATIMAHIQLAKWAEYILVAPSSANTLAKLATGFADNLLTSTILASNAVKVLLPAMNQQIWQNQLTQHNLHKLINFGFKIWGPTSGVQACGDIGLGRMLEIDEILQHITQLTTQNKILHNQHIVITAGSTQEAIDPVRYISNHSSGKMGYALAQVAIQLGAKVSLISGIGNVQPAAGLYQYIVAATADEMLYHSLLLAKTATIFIGAAAVCDFKVTKIRAQKLKKPLSKFNLSCEINKDIISEIKLTYPTLFTIGFAAETEDLANNALKKLATKNLDMIIANDVSNKQVFDQDFTAALIINKHHEILESGRVTKTRLAELIFDKMWDNIQQQRV